MNYTLRPYQTEALAKIRAAIRAGHKRILCLAPTGAGKTILFCLGIVHSAFHKGSTVWIVVPWTQLIIQTSRKLDELGIDHGIIQGNHWRTRHSASIQVCSKDTLRNRFKDLRPPDVIVWDEAHHMTKENTYGKIQEQFPEAYHIGFTATACRLDGKGLGGIFTFLVIVSTINQLVAGGFLIPSRVFGSKRNIDISKVGINHATRDYNQKQLGEAMDKPKLIGDIVAEWHKHALGRPTIVFAVHCQHAKDIQDAFVAHGRKWEYIDAHTPQEERQRILGLLERREIDGVSSVGVFTEGFDCPAVGCVIFARKTLSLSLVIQMAGRGLRPEFGIARKGEYCVFLDHAQLFGDPPGHGFITDDRDWTLDDGIVLRKGGEYTCPACFAKMRGWPRFCPACGVRLSDDEKDRNALPEPKEIEYEAGELEEITPTNAPPIDPEEINRKRRSDFARWAMEAKLRGHTPVSVNIKFKKVFGEWPNHRDQKDSNVKIKWRAASPVNPKGAWVFEVREEINLFEDAIPLEAKA
jgi:DNA repair protein RadD